MGNECHGMGLCSEKVLGFESVTKPKDFLEEETSEAKGT